MQPKPSPQGEGEECSMKLYSVRAYRFGKCYGKVLEGISHDAATKYVDAHQGVNGWEYYIEEDV